MKGLFRHPVRVAYRLPWLLTEFALAAINYARWCGRNASGSQRAVWMQKSSRRILRVLNAQIRASGTVPKSGLLVSNHLGYVDILVIASVTPAMFVAKREVSGWPVFGFFAKLGGTLFVDRERRTRVGHTTGEIDAALKDGSLVVLFPEGTSSDGKAVLPFKSSLLEPATHQVNALFASHVQYKIEDGEVGEEACYWRDEHTLVPHLLNLLGKKTVHAEVRFTQMREASTDRKELAKQLHSEILRLKEATV